MKDFIVLRHLLTPLALSGLKAQQVGVARWKFDIPAAKQSVLIQEVLAPYFGIMRTTGLDFYAKIQAKDSAGAKAASEDLIATVYGLMCFQGRTYVEQLTHLSTLEVVDGKDDLYSYALRAQPPLRATTRVVLDQAQFNELWEADTGLAGTDKTKRRHLHMAMAMLRNGTGAGREVSKFLQYWIGIAALDHQLKELEGANASKGWTAIFAKHSLDYAQFNEARNRLAHPSSPGNFMKAYAFATNNMDALEPVLAGTIGRLYGMSPDFMDRITKRKAMGPNEAWSVLGGRVEGVPEDLNEIPTKFPHYVYEPGEITAEIVDDKTVNLRRDDGAKANFGEGVKGTIEYFEQHAMDLSHIHGSDMTITGPTVKPSDQ